MPLYNFNMKEGYDFITETETGCTITVKLVPNSSFSKIVNITNEFVRIKISSPPLENRANKELISFLSEKLDVNKSKIELVSGDKSKFKKVFVKDTKKEYIVQKICL